MERWDIFNKWMTVNTRNIFLGIVMSVIDCLFLPCYLMLKLKTVGGQRSIIFGNAAMRWKTIESNRLRLR